MRISISLHLSSWSLIPLPRFIRASRPTPLSDPSLVLFPPRSTSTDTIVANLHYTRRTCETIDVVQPWLCHTVAPQTQLCPTTSDMDTFCHNVFHKRWIFDIGDTITWHWWWNDTTLGKWAPIQNLDIWFCWRDTSTGDCNWRQGHRNYRKTIKVRHVEHLKQEEQYLLSFLLTLCFGVP